MEKGTWIRLCRLFVSIGGISQCRTAVLALAVALVCYILLKSKHKVRWSFFTLIIVLFLWNNSVTRRFIDQALLLTKYAGADINTFSSGRLDGWDRALATFAKSPFLDADVIMLTARISRY